MRFLRLLTELKPTPSGCLEFTGSRYTGGYGIINDKGKSYPAHRWVWLFFFNPDLESHEHILHSCHNRLCCNPSHLREGSRKENMRDKIKDGTHKRGSGIGNSRLTERDVHNIRKRIAAGEGNRSIAADYNIHHASISCIRVGKSWSWLDTPEEEQCYY